MKCPLCGHSIDRVIETRQSQSGITIRRRRECLSCEYRFTSYERVEENPIQVIKKSGKRELFDPEKIEKGIRKAFGKKAIEHNALENLIHEIEERATIISRSAHEISTDTIGKLVLEKLLYMDRVVYLRFASVHDQFQDFQDFIKFMERAEKVDSANEPALI